MDRKLDSSTFKILAEPKVAAALSEQLMQIYDFRKHDAPQAVFKYLHRIQRESVMQLLDA